MSVKVMGLVWDLPLGRDEKFVLLAYADHADHGGHSIFPSVHLVASKTGYSERSIQVITRKLEAKGLLRQEGRGPHGTNSWRIPIVGGAISAPAASAPVQQRTGGGADSGVQGMQTTSPKPSTTVKRKPSKEAAPSFHAARELGQEEDATIARRVARHVFRAR